MFRKKTDVPIAIGDKPSVCMANTMVDSRVSLWCGLEDPKRIEQIASAMHRHAQDTLVLGVNANYSVALRCKSGEDMREYKKLLASWEIQTLNTYLLNELSYVKTKAGAQGVLKLLRILENRDLVLKEMCELAEAHLNKQMDKLSDEDEVTTRKDMHREDFEKLNIGRLPKELSSVGKTRPFEDTIQYSLSLCATPKREAQKWREDVMTIRARKGTYPIGAVNATHAVLIYCDPKASFDEYDLTAEFICLPHDNLRCKTDWKMTFRVPKLESDQGVIVHTALDSSSTRCIVGFGSYVFILDPQKDKRTAYRCSENRIVNCVALDGAVALAGTTQGEVFRFDEENFHVHYTPMIEPVLKAVWLPKSQVMCMMTCMSIFVETTNGRLLVNLLRPVTFHADDEILATYCKYGFVQVQPTMMINLANSFDPIEKEDVSDLPAYDGVYMDQKQLIIVESHGRVRVWNPQ